MKYAIRDRSFDKYEDFFKSVLLLLRSLRTYFSKIFVAIIASITFSACQSEEKIKFEQYYIGGKELYEQNCANCHQKDGTGFKELYPPIVGSEYLKDKSQVISIIKNGLSGEIVVKGKKYNQPMPANHSLTNLDIAEITTYIYAEWQGEKKITDVKEVENTLK
ncbi:hypothetical protein Emtol_3691 [Emticicia oligotrophica DSM 17448]|uniref:Cytochrome c domain-containing protein n=1 Tax=Emticicia oligotrophica (strain DSM 17448 / CIP 109782 / MTCC 6937 / GPTSA100-15) TaxID=929562 RepID=A0ABM5N5V4_EMTOG|nr:cytochrome c [Emticicia oligotrophica]AFK04817.1 hypothetical protein Emtol_3691 [Emticicia oligotrophica DSM 17448]